MNEIFMIFLSLSLSGSLIAGLLFLLKPLFKDRLSKTWQYYILLIVILRLLVPLGPETSLVGTIFKQAGSRAYTENTSAVNMPEINLTSQTMPKKIQQRPEDNANSMDYLRSAGETAINLLWLGWLVPALILMLRKVISYRYSVGSINGGSIKIDDGHVMDIYREVNKAMKIRRFPQLVQNESVAAPMLVGTIRPVIVLPDISIEDKDMRYVLQHELIHYKRLDIIYKWLAQITLCLHWFNPLVYRICREINRNCELSCDEAIIKRLDETEKYAYGDMLLETIKLNKKSYLPVVSLTLNEDTKLIKERLSAIMKFKKISRISTAVSLALAAFLLCGAVYVGAYAQIEEDGYQKEYTLSNGEPVNISVPKNGLYTFMSARHRQTGDMSSLTAEFHAPDALAPATPAKVSENTQTVVYESVEMRYYEEVKGFSIPAHPYIHDIKTNNTNKKITEHKRGMLAYDKDGNPLRLIGFLWIRIWMVRSIFCMIGIRKKYYPVKQRMCLEDGR